MFFVYGSATVKIASKGSYAVCPHCNSQGTLRYKIMSSHYHLFWVPMFAYDRFKLVECKNCKTTYKQFEMNESMLSEYENFKRGRRSPFWQYTGVIIIISFILLMIFGGISSSIQNNEYINEPLEEDVYSIEMDSVSFSTMKVKEILNNEVIVCYNDYATDNRFRVMELDKDEHYSENFDTLSKREIKEMYDDDIIFEIERNKVIYKDK